MKVKLKVSVLKPDCLTFFDARGILKKVFSYKKDYLTGREAYGF